MNTEGSYCEKKREKKDKTGKCTCSYTLGDLVKVLSYSLLTPEEASG